MAEEDTQEALVHLMVSMAAADGAISDTELRELGNLLQTLPVFDGFSVGGLDAAARHCTSLLESDDGIDTIIDNVKRFVPQKLHETAYALAVEVAAADLTARQSELRYLEMLRDALGIDRLQAGAIEHSARVRYRRL